MVTCRDNRGQDLRQVTLHCAASPDVHGFAFTVIFNSDSENDCSRCPFLRCKQRCDHLNIVLRNSVAVV